MDKLIENIFKITFSVLGFNIDFGNFVGTIRSLCNWNIITGTSIWGLASNLHNVVVPIGLSLLTLFFLMDICIYIQYICLPHHLYSSIDGPLRVLRYLGCCK